MTMTRLIAAARFVALGAAGAATLSVSLPAVAQGYGSLAEGRAVFDRLGCNACHSYVSRRVAPSIRDLMRDFSGDPLAIADATRASAAHKEDTQFPRVDDTEMRSISEWLGGISWPEPVVAEAPPAAPSPVVPAAVVETPVPIAVPVVESAPVAAVPLPSVAVAAIHLEKGKPRSDRLVIEMTGGEPELVDLQMQGERLLISIAGARLAEGIPPSRANWPGSRVVSAIDSVDRGGSVELTVSSRVAAWSYTGMQGKRRMIIDLTAAAKQPVAKKSSPAVAVAKAAVPVTAKPAKAAKSAAAPAVAQATASSTAKAASTPLAAAAAVVAAAPAEASPAAAAAAPPPAQASTPTAVVAAVPAVVASPAAVQSPELPPVQIAMAKPESAPHGADTPVKRKTNLKYRDGSDLKPCPPASADEQVIGAFDVDAVKEIMDRVGCPQCHAYVQKKTGPPFRDVIKKYKGDPACVIHRLKTNPTHKDEGVTRDIQAHEFKPIADYVATRIK
jgi:cytochrome c551/c552